MSLIKFNRALTAAAIFILSSPVAAQDVESLKALQNNVMVSGTSYEDLRELTTNIGPRPSGSDNAARAVEWAVAKMKSYGLDKVWTQPVQVPKWVRGNTEIAAIIEGETRTQLMVAALGRSAGTKGLDSAVIEVRSLDEARELGEKARGKIIFYNRPMDATLDDTFAAYGRAMDQRSSGPNLASRLGASAVLVRSLTTLQDDDHPHTGATYFSAGVTPIPAAALSTHAANILSARLKANPELIVHLELSAETHADVTSYNVIGEIRGRELPDEIVLVGAHLDSWDLGRGAHDDGAGVTQSIDICRAFKHLNIVPRRTIRCVLFMAEEPGGIGGEEYALQAKNLSERHIMAVESDRGAFTPKKFSVDGSSEDLDLINSWLPLFEGTGIESIYLGGSGTDVEPLAALGTLTMEIVPDSKLYFDYHHAATDQFEAVSKIELTKGTSALMTMVYQFSEK